MQDTSLSLLGKLQNSADDEAWARLMELYAPLLRSWLRRYNVQPSDTDDLVQEVLVTLATGLKHFEHRGQAGAFRAWLRSIMVNRLRAFWRSQQRHPQAPADSDMALRLEQFADPASETSGIWNREHDQAVVNRLLSLVEPHFARTTWEAFYKVTLMGLRADEVAEQLGISVNAVFIAKSRVLRRLRQEAAGLVDPSSEFLAKS